MVLRSISQLEMNGSQWESILLTEDHLKDIAAVVPQGFVLDPINFNCFIKNFPPLEGQKWGYSLMSAVFSSTHFSDTQEEVESLQE